MSVLPRKVTNEDVPGGLHSESRVLSVVSQYAAMQAVLAASGLIRNKIVAYKLGPSAFGDLTQISFLASLVAALVTFGLGVGISRNTAKARTLEERQGHLANANFIVLGLSAVGLSATVALLFSGHLLPAVGLTQTSVAVVATLIFLAAVPLDGLKNNYLSLLNGIMDVKGLATRRSAGVLLATILAAPIVWYFGFVGAALQYLLLGAFAAVLLGWRCRSLGYSPLGVQANARVMAQLASFGLVSMASGFAQSLADTAIRKELIEHAGSVANGLLQAPYLLSHTVKSVVLMSVGSVSLAVLSSQADLTAKNAAVNRLLNVVVPVGVSALGALGLFGSFALTLLYSSEFTPAAALFPALLCGDLLTVFVRVTGAPLLASGDRMRWVVLELLFSAVRWALAVLLIPTYGSMAVVVGYLLATVLHASLNYGFFRLRYALVVRAVHFARLAFGAVLVGGLATVGSRTGAPAWVYAAAGALWLVYTAVYARDILGTGARGRVSSPR